MHSEAHYYIIMTVSDTLEVNPDSAPEKIPVLLSSSPAVRSGN